VCRTGEVNGLMCRIVRGNFSKNDETVTRTGVLLQRDVHGVPGVKTKTEIDSGLHGSYRAGQGRLVRPMLELLLCTGDIVRLDNNLTKTGHRPEQRYEEKTHSILFYRRHVVNRFID
jgi:hypothetical protein